MDWNVDLLFKENMKIGLDLDGCVIDLYKIWFERLSILTGVDYNLLVEANGTIENSLGLSLDVIKSIYTPEIYKYCLPEEKAIEGVINLEKLCDKIVIVSHTYEGFDEAKVNWLTKYFPSINFDIRLSRTGEKKNKYLNDCSFFIDDFQSNFEDVKAHCLLFSKPWNQKTNLGIRVKGWNEVNSKIKELLKIDSEIKL